MKLRPYHNPQRVDESKVPEGWRMLYADEFPLPQYHMRPCRLFSPYLRVKEFSNSSFCLGNNPQYTYIVPVR